MIKNTIKARQEEIIRLINTKKSIKTKKQLVELLIENGFDTSESTVSNDLIALNIVKDPRLGYSFINRQEHNATFGNLSKMITSSFSPAPHITIIRYDRNQYTAAEISAQIMKNRLYSKKDEGEIAILESLNGNLVVLSKEEEFRYDFPRITRDEILARRKI